MAQVKLLLDHTLYTLVIPSDAFVQSDVAF